MKINKVIILIVIVLLCSLDFFASDVIVFSNTNELLNIGKQVYLLEDKTNQLTIDDVVGSNDFVKSEQEVPNFGVTSSSIWMKIEIQNKLDVKNLILSVNNPLINQLELYSIEDNNHVLNNKFQLYQKFSERIYDDPNYLFDINIKKNEVKTYYLKVNSYESIQIPIQIGSIKQTIEIAKSKDFFIGIYLGIMLVTIFYNLFIFISVKDKSYLYYVIYIGFVMLTQISVLGYSYQYLWGENHYFNQFGFMIVSVFTGVFGLEFLKHFLKVKKYNRFLYKLSYILYLFYTVSISLFLFGYYNLGVMFRDVSAILAATYMLVVSIYILRKGSQPAKYFLFAWSIFLVGIIFHVLERENILLINNITHYMMLIGSALETILLSLALADRINILKKEKIDALAVNQELILNQNIFLEQKVRERTLEVEKQKIVIEQQRVKEVNSLRYKALTAQMNPHFIFNSLNSIRSFVLDNEPVKADGFLTKFAKLMRSMLDNSREDYCCLLDEVEALTNYLELEKLRFENKFDFSIIVDPVIDLEEEKIPSFLLQPYIENAVLHGLINKDGGHISVIFKSKEGGVECLIEDNGMGRGSINKNIKPYKSVGMSITKERLSAIGSNSYVNIIDLIDDKGNPSGTKVKVQINNN